MFIEPENVVKALYVLFGGQYRDTKENVNEVTSSEVAKFNEPYPQNTDNLVLLKPNLDITNNYEAIESPVVLLDKYFLEDRLINQTQLVMGSLLCYQIHRMVEAYQAAQSKVMELFRQRIGSNLQYGLNTTPNRSSLGQINVYIPVEMVVMEGFDALFKHGNAESVWRVRFKFDFTCVTTLVSYRPYSYTSDDDVQTHIAVFSDFVYNFFNLKVALNASDSKRLNE